MTSKEIFDKHLENMDDVFDNKNFFGESLEQKSDGKSPTYQNWIDNVVEMEIKLDDLKRMGYYTEGRAFIAGFGPFELGIIPLELAVKSLGQEEVQKYIDSPECKKYQAISFNREESEYSGVFNPLFNY